MKESQRLPADSEVAARCRYLYALCCYKLQNYPAGENALLPSTNRSRMRSIPNKLPQTAESLNLLGKIYRQENKTAKAIEFFKRALKKDPFLWSAFEAICELGGDPEVNALFPDPDNNDRAMMETDQNINLNTFNNTYNSNSLNINTRTSINSYHQHHHSHHSHHNSNNTNPNSTHNIHSTSLTSINSSLQNTSHNNLPPMNNNIISANRRNSYQE
eukprot:UN29200